MQRPGAEASHQERITKLRLACRSIREISERSVERFDAGSPASVDHLADRVVPEILLKGHTWCIALCVRKNLIVGMPATDARRFHGTGRCEIRRAKAHAVHARRGSRDGFDIIDALRSF